MSSSMVQDAQAGRSCPVCAGTRIGPAFERNGHAIVQCDDCAFLFVAPYPSPHEVAAFYNTGYRDASSDNYPKAASRRRRAVGRAARLAPYIWRKSVLELGCGGGFMTWAMSLIARRTVGVDVSAGAIAYAQGHFPRSEFRVANLSQTAGCGEVFDVVFSSELFEHLAGVEEVMACIAAVTRPGSLVYVATPDVSHPNRPPLAEWDVLCPPEHLQWFGRDNLALLFDRFGFEPYRYLRSVKPAHNVFFRRR